MSSRTRTRGGFAPVAQNDSHRRGSNCSETSLVHNGTGPFNVFGGSLETMYDTTTKGFRKLQAAGKVIFSPMYKTKYSVDYLGGNGWQIKSDAQSCSSPVMYVEIKLDVGNWVDHYIPMSGGITPVPTIQGIHSDADIASLCTEVSTSVLSQRGRSDSNLWETLAELDKTAAMFNVPISRLTSIFNDAAKAKKAGKFAGYALNGMSNLWLAYRYGIKPIVSDINGIMAGLKKTAGKQRKTTRDSKGLNAQKTISSPLTFDAVTVVFNREITDLVKVRAMSLDEVDLSLLNNIGFSSKGLITLPWELVRFSFVADWIGNVGDVLGAISPAVGWNQLGSCLVIDRVITNNVIAGANSMAVSGWSLQTPLTGGYHLQQETKQRTSLSPAGFVIRSDFRFDSFTRAADALTLLGQQAYRLFR